MTLGVSVGKINHCLKCLVKKSFVKINNYRNISINIQYSHFLTLKEEEKKAKLTFEFLKSQNSRMRYIKTRSKEYG